MSGAESQHLRLVYDGDCPLCRGMANALTRARLVPLERIRAFQDLEGELSERLWNAGIRNEMAVLDEASGAIRSGVDGLLWIVRSSWARPLVALAALPPVLALARVAYRLVAYNRHLLAPKDPARVRCDCDADFHLGYRLGLLVPAIAFALAVVLAFAATLVPGAGEGGARSRHVLALAASFGGWAVAAALGSRRARERAFDWFGHLALAADLGAIALLPAVILASWVEGPALRAVQLGAGAAALFAVGVSLTRRLRLVGRGPVVLLAVTVVLASSVRFLLLPLTG